jgi:hypothetical protein
MGGAELAHRCGWIYVKTPWEWRVRDMLTSLIGPSALGRTAFVEMRQKPSIIIEGIANSRP